MCWFSLRATWRALSLRVVVHVPIEGAWLCIRSSPPSPGHLGFLVYIPLGGVPNELQTSRVLLLVLRCIYILTQLAAMRLAGQTMDASSYVLV